MPSRYTFVRSLGLYRDRQTAALVPPERVSGWIVETVEKSERNLTRLARRLKAGKINTAEWVIAHGEELRNLHRSVAMVAAGGRSQMTLSSWGSVGARLRSELSYLGRFAAEVENLPDGTVLNDAFVSRAASYANSAYVTYENGVRQRVITDGIADLEESILGGAAEHCFGCLAEAARGRVAIGRIVPIGGRDCGPRCKCRIVYYKTTERGVVRRDLLRGLPVGRGLLHRA